MRTAFPRPRRASISIFRERDGRRCVHPWTLYFVGLCKLQLPCMQLLDINLCLYRTLQSRGLQRTPLLRKPTLILFPMRGSAVHMASFNLPFERSQGQSRVYCIRVSHRVGVQ